MFQSAFGPVLREQGADEVRIGQYAARWWRWANAGVTLTDLTGLPPALRLLRC